MENEDSSILDVCNFDDCAIFEIHLLLSIKNKNHICHSCLYNFLTCQIGLLCTWGGSVLWYLRHVVYVRACVCVCVRLHEHCKLQISVFNFLAGNVKFSGMMIVSKREYVYLATRATVMVVIVLQTYATVAQMFTITQQFTWMFNIFLYYPQKQNFQWIVAWVKSPFSAMEG